jgi:hypothetical protein
MVVLENQYVLFTKNRGNKNSNIYISPLGKAAFKFQDSIAVPGRITDAFYHPISNKILLLSYNFTVINGFQCQLTVVNVLKKGRFEVVKSFDIEYPEQFEAIIGLQDNAFLIGSENGFAKGGNLYKIVLEGL